jgi:hypothetical protein
MCSGAATVVDRFDYVFWFGDLNYRVNGTRNMVDACLQTRRLEVLLANDQLTLEMKKSHVFQGFSEGAITFVPTYKFELASTNFSYTPTVDDEDSLEDLRTPIATSPNTAYPTSPLSPSPTSPGSPGAQSVSASRTPTSTSSAGTKLRRDRTGTRGEYDQSRKARIPSWTDRILFKTRSMAIADGRLLGVQVRRYISVMAMMSSDHKPVIGDYELVGLTEADLQKYTAVNASLPAKTTVSRPKTDEGQKVDAINASTLPRKEAGSGSPRTIPAASKSPTMSTGSKVCVVQ